MSDGFRILFARTYHFAVLVYISVVAVHQVVANHKAQTRGRLDQLHGPNQSLTLRSRPGGGTEVVAAFPFQPMI